MNIKTSTKNLALVAGILGVCGLGFLAPSASARPRSTTRTTTRTTTVVRTRPVTRTTTIVRTTPVVRNRTIVRTPPVVRNRTIITNRPVVVRPRTTIVRRPINRNRYANQNSIYDGSVTYVAAGRFGISVGGRRYTVFVSSGIPRSLSRGDLVRVVGVRNGNSIQTSRVSITRNV